MAVGKALTGLRLSDALFVECCRLGLALHTHFSNNGSFYCVSFHLSSERLVQNICVVMQAAVEAWRFGIAPFLTPVHVATLKFKNNIIMLQQSSEFAASWSLQQGVLELDPFQWLYVHVRRQLLE